MRQPRTLGGSMITMALVLFAAFVGAAIVIAMIFSIKTYGYIAGIPIGIVGVWLFLSVTWWMDGGS